MSSQVGDSPPVFFAVSSSARQIFHLLKCINFSSKASIQITNTGLKVYAQDSQVMQGFVVLQSDLFTSYVYSPPHVEEDSDDEPEPPFFTVNLDALLETLQIFGVNDGKNSGPADAYTSGISRTRRDALDVSVLGMGGVCKLTYAGEGSPFSIVIEEAGVTTTCEMNTYEADNIAHIPFDSESVVSKVITRSEWLFDAVKELSSANPTKLNFTTSTSAPYFTLSAAGPHGSATVEFKKDPQLLETFKVIRKESNTYKYSLIKGASRAMAVASKVSIRNDEQGILSLQFLVEVEESKTAFVDFRFIPFIAEEEEEDGETDEATASEEGM